MAVIVVAVMQFPGSVMHQRGQRCSLGGLLCSTQHSADYVKSLQFINNGVVTVGKYAHVLKAVRIISSTMCAIGFDRISTQFKFLRLFFSTGP